MHVCVCMYMYRYWRGYVIYGLRTVLYNSCVVICMCYTSKSEYHSIHRAEKDSNDTLFSVTCSQPVDGEKLTYDALILYNTYIQVRTPNSMQEDSWPLFRAPLPSRYHLKKRTALPPATKLLSHVDHPKN